MSTFSNENHVTRSFTSNAINEFAFRLLGQVFEAMMENRQDQIPDEGFLMTKKKKKKKSKQRPNTETVCADIPCIAVKNTKVV
jgi:hypothetical protein